MTKGAGMGDQFYLAGYDLSGDIGSVEVLGGGPALLDVTGINKSAHERIGGLRDGRIAFTSFFNPDANASHDRLENLPTADQIVTYAHGEILGNDSTSLVAKQIDYNPTRGTDGSLTFKVSALANGFGLEWGRQLTAGLDLLGGAGAGTGVDFAAETLFGLQAYLHVTLFSGTSATVAIQDNTVDVAGTYANVAGAAFTAATGIGSERIQTARDATVRRWLRVNVTGTFSALVFFVQVTKNVTSTVF